MTKKNNKKMKEYIDLGLPSGTLWCSKNEEDYYTYNEAVEKFKDNLPSRKQWEELKNECVWTWIGKGYKVIGHNENSIFLPAMGYGDCNGCMNLVGSCGNYWSSTPNDIYAWYLFFSSGRVIRSSSFRCSKHSIRLVK